MTKVAVLGAGYMGQLHARNITQAGAAEVVAVCSRPFDTAQALNAKLLAGKARCFEDFDQMLKEADFDALFVCLPPFAHAGEIQKAAKARKHVFVEKPLGLDVKKATEMAALAKKSRVITQMGYHMRYGAAVKRLKNMIDDGAAGRPTLFHGSFQCNALHTPWWRDAKKSGGQIIEQIIHIYDLATYFLGKPKTVSTLVSNICHKKVAGYTNEDTSASIIGFAGGPIASITGSNCAIPCKWRGMFTIVCENVTAEFIDHNNAIFTQHGGKPAEEWWPTGKLPEACEIKSTDDAHAAGALAFLNSIAGGPKPSADLAQGALTLKLVTAAMKSAKAGGKQVIL